MRRRRAPKRNIKTDPKYDSPVVGNFVNIIMRDGKKSIAQKIIYDAFDIISEVCDFSVLGSRACFDKKSITCFLGSLVSIAIVLLI